ncbi:MAG: glycosyltransferase [Candidatus Hodarchaeota archaeon]
MADEFPSGIRKKILAIVGAIPCRNNIYAGIFTINQIIELTKTGKYKIDIIFPRPMFPKLANWIGPRFGKNIFVLDRPLDPKIEGINIHLLPYLHVPKLGTLIMILTAYFYILFKGLEFDIIHAYFLFFPGYLGVKLGNLFKKPVVAMAMGSDVNLLFDRSVRGEALKPNVIQKIILTLERADSVVAVSDYLRRRIMGLGISEHKMRVISTGISKEKFQLFDMKECLLGGKKKTILYVGNLLVEKGLVQLLEAIEILRGKRDDFSLAIIGDGPFKRELVELIEKFRLREFVRLEGAKEHDEIPHWISKSHVVCLPSYSEGLPNVVLEGIACGRPVVASNVGGIPEIINDSKLGTLVPPRDARKLAEALEDALDKEWKHEVIAKSGARFYWENVLPKIEALYNELM